MKRSYAGYAELDLAETTTKLQEQAKGEIEKLLEHAEYLKAELNKRI